MDVNRAENLREELINLREKALDLGDSNVGLILSRLIRIVCDVIAYLPKENNKESRIGF